MCHNLELFQGQGGGPSVLTSLLGQGQVVRHFNFLRGHHVVNITSSKFDVIRSLLKAVIIF